MSSQVVVRSDAIAGGGTEPRAAESFGVYVHVPFCRRICDYCAFATWEGIEALAPRYVAGCLTELAAVLEPTRPVSTVFLGGGTPSLLPAELVAQLLAAMPLAPGAEVSLEANPEDVTAATVGAWRVAGVNRISLGVQSLSAAALRSLGRDSTPGVALAALETVASSGLEDWSVDLIFGAAGESGEDWEATLAGVLRFAPPHVSLYGLTVERGTPLQRDPSRHPDDDVEALRYERADQLLAMAGLEWYEISNWARPGHECRHNLNYWRQGSYRGVGCAAHSHEAGRRWWNLRSPERYLAAIEAGRSPVAGEERLDAGRVALEAAMLGLRTRAGVPAGWLCEAGPGGDEVLPLELDGLVEVREGRAVLTRAGRLLENEVARRLHPPPGAAAESQPLCRRSAPTATG